MNYFQVLGMFLGIVHFIDAGLAYVEHRKFKIQIISQPVSAVKVWTVLYFHDNALMNNKWMKKWSNKGRAATKVAAVLKCGQ